MEENKTDRIETAEKEPVKHAETPKPKKEKKEKRKSDSGDVSGLAEKMRDKLAKALNKKPNACVGLKKGDNGLWIATIEVVEEEHIPSKFDMLGIYQAEFDDKLNLKGWEKKQQRIRG